LGSCRDDFLVAVLRCQDIVPQPGSASILPVPPQAADEVETAIWTCFEPVLSAERRGGAEAIARIHSTKSQVASRGGPGCLIGLGFLQKHNLQQGGAAEYDARALGVAAENSIERGAAAGLSAVYSQVYESLY
jgi:hypothetical protein